MSNGWDAFVKMILDFFRGFGGSGGIAEPEPHAGAPGGDGPGTALGDPVSLGQEPISEVPQPSGADEPSAPGGEPFGTEEGGGAMLKGKGVWAYREHELERAIQIAPQMGATHVLYKVAHGANYRAGMAQVAQTIKGSGLPPLLVAGNWPG